MSPDGSPPPAPAADQRDRPAGEDFADIVGFIDAIGGNRVLGWAWNRNRPEEKLAVEVSLDNKPVATVCADEFRDHLKKAGIGDGAHGFEAHLPEPLAKEEKHRVSAFVHRPGHGGTIRLKNQAAVSTEPLTLRSSDFAALVEQIEQCVSDQRAGFRWLYHELHALDEFVRSEADAPRTIEASAPAPQPDLGDEFCAVDSRFSEVLQNQASMREAVDGITAMQQALNRRLDQLDLLSPRLDAILAELRQPGAEAAIGSEQRGLKRLVIGLACLTLASLATGIAALFG